MSHSLNRTTCEAAFRRLDDFLDRRLPHAEMHLIEEHLEICAACAREFTFEASVLTEVRQKLRQLSVPPDLMARIAAQIRAAGEGGRDVVALWGGVVDSFRVGVAEVGAVVVVGGWVVVAEGLDEAGLDVVGRSPPGGPPPQAASTAAQVTSTSVPRRAAVNAARRWRGTPGRRGRPGGSRCSPRR